jgi:hypothetical protein
MSIVISSKSTSNKSHHNAIEDSTRREPLVFVHMPPKIRPALREFQSLASSPLNSPILQIDFNAVGVATSLKSPAARMRYTRLRRQIESGTLVGTHGQPFACPQAIPNTGLANGTPGKRKRSLDAEFDGYGDEKGKDDQEYGIAMVEGEHKVKQEWDADENLRDGSASDDDSEDDIPLAKLRGVRIGNWQEGGVVSHPPAPHVRHKFPLINATNTSIFKSQYGLVAQQKPGELFMEKMQESRPSNSQTWFPRYVPYAGNQCADSLHTSDTMSYGEQRYVPCEVFSNEGQQ